MAKYVATELKPQFVLEYAEYPDASKSKRDALWYLQETDTKIDAAELLRQAIGEHYDIKVMAKVEQNFEGHPIEREDGTPLVQDFLIMIYDKGGRLPRLTFVIVS